MSGKKLLFIAGASVLALIIILFYLYSLIFSPSVTLRGKGAVILIPDSASYGQVMDSVYSKLEIKHRKTLSWLAVRKEYPTHIKPGRYVIEKPLSCSQLINILRGGRQSPVKITFSNVRTINEIAGKIGGRIEADSAEIVVFFSDPENFRKDGFNSATVISVFIPNTYEFFWNTSPGRLYSRMLREYERFWNRDRKRKAEDLGLTPVEVSVLASIVDEEVAKSDEKPRVAGVYLNRLRLGMPLQACPTIRFALNDYTITRVLNKYLTVDSPYNTYKYKGLPPGPIRCPSVDGIEAVLNAEHHDYLYFAAKPDFSGYNSFSRTLSEHNR
ncbi:MAG: endolytic transglycosylase MltG, partial [Bacteroidales bacterium]